MNVIRLINQPAPGTQHPRIVRWECHCQSPPVLLATYDRETGAISIKARDRYWTVHGSVRAHCPLCGTEHTLAIEPANSSK